MSIHPLAIPAIPRGGVPVDIGREAGKDNHRDDTLRQTTIHIHTYSQLT